MKKARNRDIGVCIFCDSIILRDDDIFNIAIDRPMRMDLLVHKVCYNNHRKNNTVKLFLQKTLLEYLQKYYDYEEDHGEKAQSHKTKNIRE